MTPDWQIDRQTTDPNAIVILGMRVFKQKSSFKRFV